jgi:hypothetical protein
MEFNWEGGSVLQFSNHLLVGVHSEQLVSETGTGVAYIVLTSK